ncbi:MAG: quinol:cytochrome C oxidoreductase, partial [Ignavibacteriales bacterium]|nr:quinol:cytochrome C oxidoreductase [Ignavibacteriales bacterium]
MSEQTNLAPKPLPPKILAIGAIMIAVGLIFGVALYATQPERAMFSYLLGFQFALSVALGGLFLVALEYVTNAVWSAPIRRAPEFLAVAIPFLLVSAFPLVFNLDLLFEWAVPEIVKEDPLI